MKIQCDVCAKAPATVICCMDEAALCARCDIEGHAANKLASKHQRLHLQCLSNKLPKCDICQVIHFMNPHFVFYILFIITIIDGFLSCVHGFIGIVQSICLVDWCVKFFVLIM